MRVHNPSPLLLFTGFAITLFAGACGSDETPLPPPDPRICSANWRVIYSPDQTVLPPFGSTGDAFIRTHGDRVFVNADATIGLAPPGLRSVPTRGGAASIVYEGWVRAFWIEDDGLVMVTDSSLQRVPLSGGAPERALAIGALERPTPGALVGPWALDRDALYWASNDYVESAIWRAPRDGSGDQKIATLPAGELGGPPVSFLEQLDDGRLIVISGRRVWTIGTTGGELRELSLADDLVHFLGIAPDGTMLWTRFVGNSDGNHTLNALVKLHVDDAAPGPPILTYDVLSVAMQNAAPDGNGGFYLLAWEFGTDGGIHTTTWALDADDRLTRIACDPEIQRLPLGGVGTPDTFYAVVGTLNDWQVVAISRTP